jgi:hypothetical protein
VNGHDLFLDAKGDNLRKHEGWTTAKCDKPRLGKKKGDSWMNANSKHKKAERIYSSLPLCNIQTIVAQGNPPKRKEVQMAIVFHLLSFGRPMLEYEHMQGLLEQLGCPKLPLKHWSDSSEWEMAESLYNVVQKQTRRVVCGTRYFSLSCDEVTTVDNQSWISIHAYVLVDWERIPLLLSLERLTEGSTSDQITRTIMSAVGRDGGLSAEEVRQRLLCFGSDGASVLQGKKNGVVVQIQGAHAPHCQGMHCVAHRTDLAVEVLSELDMVSSVEKLLKKLHSYFSKSPKRHLELEKLSELMVSKGGKILNNVKTRWISMLSPLKRVLSEYRVLLVKMYGDMLAKPVIKGAAANFHRLADVQTLLSLAALLPLLESIKNLVVFAQSPSVYVCDFTRALKLCFQDIHHSYKGPSTAFRSDAFTLFNSICNLNHGHIKLRWQPDLNNGVEHLVFEAQQETSAGSHLNATCFNPETNVQGFVTRDLWEGLKERVKRDVESKCLNLASFSFMLIVCVLLYLFHYAYLAMVLVSLADYEGQSLSVIQVPKVLSILI